tara:strand:+ start:174 stop:602 length:429 start_codon:yes stop_codon:yes gene_type:complete
MSSASSRLAKLKRSSGPMINDVNQIQGNNQLQGNNQTQGNEQPRNMVQPGQILGWHEQRLNKMDDLIALLEKSNSMNEADVVLPIVESIEVLENQIKSLQKQINELKTSVKNTNKGHTNNKQIKKEVEQSLNKMKLNVKEKV